MLCISICCRVKILTCQIIVMKIMITTVIYHDNLMCTPFSTKKKFIHQFDYCLFLFLLCTQHFSIYFLIIYKYDSYCFCVLRNFLCLCFFLAEQKFI